MDTLSPILTDDVVIAGDGPDIFAGGRYTSTRSASARGKPIQSSLLLLVSRNDGEKQVGRISFVMIDLVDRCFAATDMVRDIFHVGCP